MGGGAGGEATTMEAAEVEAAAMEAAAEATAVEAAAVEEATEVASVEAAARIAMTEAPGRRRGSAEITLLLAQPRRTQATSSTRSRASTGGWTDGR